eukprot:2976776-Rhodomonas_salina.2
MCVLCGKAGGTPRYLPTALFCTERAYGATRCFVLRQRTVLLRVCFVLRQRMVLCEVRFRTELAYGATHCFVLRQRMVLCYAQYRTELAYGARGSFVLSSRMVLCYVQYRTELAYCATRSIVLRQRMVLGAFGTETAYGARGDEADSRRQTPRALGTTLRAPTPCPRIVSCVSLERVCYAMCGTELAYGATRFCTELAYGATRPFLLSEREVLPGVCDLDPGGSRGQHCWYWPTVCCYAMSGTAVAYGAGTGTAYAATRCPVLT